jgi:hypothetical protein
MSLPDFIGIGAQKAGSTWLYFGLTAHPGIWTTPKKEIHYFNRPSDYRDPKIWAMRKKRMGRSRLEVWSWYRRYARLPRDDRWYASLFRPGRGQIAGEVTPDYSTLDKAAVARAHGTVPGARILFFMRNPIERTWSHAVMDLRRKKRDAHTMSAPELREFFDRGYVSQRADYLRTLENWSSFYPEERIFVGFLEDVHFHTSELLGEVYGFLGVDRGFEPPGMRRKVNARSRETMPLVAVRILAESYHGDLESLSERFGGYASFWLHCAEKLIEDSPEPEEAIPYPLWESFLWRDWASGTLPPEPSAPRPADAGPRSGPLSRFRP